MTQTDGWRRYWIEVSWEGKGEDDPEGRSGRGDGEETPTGRAEHVESKKPSESSWLIVTFGEQLRIDLVNCSLLVIRIKRTPCEVVGLNLFQSHRLYSIFLADTNRVMIIRIFDISHDDDTTQSLILYLIYDRQCHLLFSVSELNNGRLPHSYLCNSVIRSLYILTS